MTHLHSIIKNALLPVCLETTAKARQEEEKSVDIDALVDPVMTELQKLMLKNPTSISKSYLEFTCQALAVITRKPYLVNAWKAEETKRRVYAPLTIVKPTETSTFVIKDMILLVLHGGTQITLSNEGTEWNYNDDSIRGYNVRLATDEEVEHFLDSLTPLAIRFILKNDLFAPMIEAMTQETELVVEKQDEQPTSSEDLDQH